MNDALKDLLYRLADDLLILGHRNSEWTGIGPLLEEDIAFSSMAQDKIGQSLAVYTLLQELGERDPDTLAFTRNAGDFRNCIFVELPNDDYDFSLVRHFLFDNALALRVESLSVSAFQPLAALAREIAPELKYHTLHANSFIQRLGSSTPESVARLQRSLEQALPYALGMFEMTKWESDITGGGISDPESTLETRWKKRIGELIVNTALVLPNWAELTPVYGGRVGHHSQHLQPLIDEMTEVFRSENNAEW